MRPAIRFAYTAIAGATIASTVDQVDFDPSGYRKALLSARPSGGVSSRPTARLGSGALLCDRLAPDIAKRLGRPRSDFSALVCLVRHPGHHQVHRLRPDLRRNAQIFDFEPAPRTRKELNALDRSGGTRAAMERKWW